MSVTDSKMEKIEQSNLSGVFRHATRHEWGNAILAWDRGDKRGYQFEDGKLRVFIKGYFDRLVEVDDPPENLKPVIGALQRRLGRSEQMLKKKPTKVDEVISFEFQLALFTEDYPKGFHGSKWAREKRGIDTTRHLKRHRETTLAEGKKLLCRSSLSTLIEEKKFGRILENLKTLYLSTDLITRAKLKILDSLTEQQTELLANTLFDFLHSDDQFTIRFERFVDGMVRATAQKPSWQLTTFIAAVFFPKERIPVKTTTMRYQAACLGKRLSIGAVPTAPKYERLCATATEVCQRLEEAGYHPRDMIDVYDFMETTLSPAARKKLAVMQQNAEPATDQQAA